MVSAGYNTKNTAALKAAGFFITAATERLTPTLFITF
jgi:hypothetical protein